MVEPLVASGDAGLAVMPRALCWDVVVVGGGPAGTTAARLLAGWGHRVALIARRPTRTHLAESLPPSCVHTLERVGVREVVDAAGFLRSSGNTVWWGRGGARVERFASDAFGYQVDRGGFDELLLAAAEDGGVSVVRSATASGVSPLVSDEWTVHCAGQDDVETRLNCRWVLDCSGRAGLLSRRDGRRRPEAGVRTMALACIWERDDESDWGLEHPDDTIVESHPGGWGWSVPSSRTRRCVALMVDPADVRLSGRSDLAEAYEAELSRTPRLGLLVRGARRVGFPWARDASPYSAVRAAEAGSLLVGDAASFVDPLSSFGVKKALSSAWLAAVVVHTCLTSERTRSAALSLFEQRERAMYEALRRRAAELAREAAGAHGVGFWAEDGRADDAARDEVGEPDVAALRGDRDVIAAFEEIRRRPSLRLRQCESMRSVKRPTVRDHTVVLEEQLAVPGFEHGLRFVRNVDLVTLAALAPHHDQVPDLYEAYHRAATTPASAPWPDFLGALSVLVAKGVLDFA